MIDRCIFFPTTNFTTAKKKKTSLLISEIVKMLHKPIYEVFPLEGQSH